MKTTKTTSCSIVLTISIASCVVSVCLCYPLKPLNERLTESTWEAWLQADQINNIQSSELTRKSPKSVFIAPESKCPEGFMLNEKGNCENKNKFKINESAHYGFVLEQLNNKQMFDYDDKEEETGQIVPTSNPFQVKFPISSNDDENKSDIIVTDSYDKITNKIDVKRNNNNYNNDNRGSSGSDDAGNTAFSVKNVVVLDVKPEDVEMTTFTAFTTRQAESSAESTHTNNEETTTIITTTTFEAPTTIIADAETTTITAETTETSTIPTYESTTIATTTTEYSLTEQIV